MVILLRYFISLIFCLVEAPSSSKISARPMEELQGLWKAHNSSPILCGGGGFYLLVYYYYTVNGKRKLSSLLFIDYMYIENYLVITIFHLLHIVARVQIVHYKLVLNIWC